MVYEYSGERSMLLEWSREEYLVCCFGGQGSVPSMLLEWSRECSKLLEWSREEYVVCLGGQERSSNVVCCWGCQGRSM